MSNSNSAWTVPRCEVFLILKYDSNLKWFVARCDTYSEWSDAGCDSDSDRDSNSDYLSDSGPVSESLDSECDLKLIAFLI